MKTAHYYASKTEKHVTIGENGRFNLDSPKHPVSGKAEANALAKKLGATPWNF